MNQDAGEFKTMIAVIGTGCSASADGRQTLARRRRSRTDRLAVVDRTRLSRIANLTRMLPRKTAATHLAGAVGEARDTGQTQPSVRQQILSLLRQGVTYREIADHLNTPEKTIRRLLRRSTTEAQPCPPS